MPDPVPTEEQRRRLCELFTAVFIDLRSADRDYAQALAYALHNLPAAMYGWGTWSIAQQRAALSHFHKHHRTGPDYAAMFDAIFP